MKAVNKDQIDSVLLDFSKAFDKVGHRKLLFKLKHYGINGDILNWIADFLQDQSQTVVVLGKSSKQTAVMSSVPQGIGEVVRSPTLSSPTAKISDNAIDGCFNFPKKRFCLATSGEKDYITYYTFFL